MRVPLEHLERQRQRHAAAAKPIEHRRFEAVGVGIVVLLADEDDIRPGDVGEHALEIRKTLTARVVDALGDVGGRRSGGRLRGLGQEE